MVLSIVEVRLVACQEDPLCVSHGAACTLQVGLVADNRHRPMDLRVLALRGAVTSVTAAGPGVPMQEWQPSGQAWEPVLMTGCVIAQEMRAVLKVSPCSAHAPLVRGHYC